MSAIIEMKASKTEEIEIYSPEHLALAEFLECAPDDISEEPYDYYGMTVFSYGSQEYAVADDDTADSSWDESLESYIDECIIPELPENMVNYFDNEAWKRDARFDGRGHSLSPYDGEENEEGEYFIYRTN